MTRDLPKKLKVHLEHLDQQIRAWRRVVQKYPNSESYRANLNKLLAERDKAAATIGKK